MAYNEYANHHGFFMTTRRVGRPTKYNDDIQAKAEEYLATWAEFDAIPSRVGLCCFIGIAKHTSFEWEAIYPEFSATLKAIDALQEHTAVNKGITGVFNSTITKLVLANHGYHDKQQTDITSNGNTLKSFSDLYGTTESES